MIFKELKGKQRSENRRPEACPMSCGGSFHNGRGKTVLSKKKRKQQCTLCVSYFFICPKSQHENTTFQIFLG